jgi:ubiquitin-like 1-activating enzyme E1 B
VFNALDNLDARRHVNKMCLAADVPLIESGTTGFNGQVQVIKKNETECYDCTPKAAPKSFAVCTIRSTPSQPIHCIVWGKSYLFAELFGTSEDDAPELDHSEDADNANEVANLQKESQALKRIRDDMGSEDFPRAVFDKVFTEDINRLRSMEDMWKTKTPPTALDFDALAKEALNVAPTIAQNDQVVWNTAENFAVFVDSLRRLSKRLEELRADAQVGNAAPVLSFDKDDVDTLDFVVASANLRSIIFGIEARSKFDIKRE